MNRDTSDACGMDRWNQVERDRDGKRERENKREREGERAADKCPRVNIMTYHGADHLLMTKSFSC